jgi:hypothetical protein
MKAHLRYLRYVVRHKWYVFVACCQLGVWWRGIIHDWTKLLPCEWFPYVSKFYGGPWQSLYNAHGDCRNWLLQFYPCTQEGVDEAFDRAWLHHQHTNKHHWQHFVLREDDGETKVLQMPDVYTREMVADWKGAGRALGFPDTAAWYVKNREHILLHPTTRFSVECFLGLKP